MKKQDRTWNNASDRRFVHRFKEHWVEVAVAFLFGVFLAGVATFLAA